MGQISLQILVLFCIHLFLLPKQWWIWSTLFGVARCHLLVVHDLFFPKFSEYDDQALEICS